MLFIFSTFLKASTIFSRTWTFLVGLIITNPEFSLNFNLKIIAMSGVLYLCTANNLEITISVKFEKVKDGIQ